jgi:hypothetical protein
VEGKMTTYEDAEVLELRNRYNDPIEERQDREHCFYRYWMSTLNRMDSIDRGTLNELVVFKEWIYPLGDIILRMCRRKMLSSLDAEWLAAQLPERSFARDQLLAYITLNDSSYDWKQKMEAALCRRADWAAVQILKAAPKAEVESLRDRIRISDRPNSTKRLLIAVADDRVNL